MIVTLLWILNKLRVEGKYKFSFLMHVCDQFYFVIYCKYKALLAHQYQSQ
jgi:hypothetical protein